MSHATPIYKQHADAKGVGSKNWLASDFMISGLLENQRKLPTSELSMKTLLESIGRWIEKSDAGDIVGVIGTMGLVIAMICAALRG